MYSGRNRSRETQTQTPNTRETPSLSLSIAVSLHRCLSTSSRLSQVPAPKAIAHSPSRRETVFRLRRRKIVISRYGTWQVVF